MFSRTVFPWLNPFFSTRQQKRMFWRNAACAPRLGRGLNESRVQHDRGLCFQIFLLLTATYGCRHDYSFIIKSVTATRVATHVMSSSLSSIFVHVIWHGLCFMNINYQTVNMLIVEFNQLTSTDWQCSFTLSISWIQSVDDQLIDFNQLTINRLKSISWSSTGW